MHSTLCQTHPSSQCTHDWPVSRGPQVPGMPPGHRCSLLHRNTERGSSGKDQKPFMSIGNFCSLLSAAPVRCASKFASLLPRGQSMASLHGAQAPRLFGRYAPLSQRQADMLEEPKLVVVDPFGHGAHVAGLVW